MPTNNASFWVHWKDLGSELWERVCSPFRYPAFVLYFIAIIIIVGGLGVWLSVYKWWFNRNDVEALISIARNLSTYLLAILATAFADLTIFNDSKSSVRMVALLFLIIGTILGTISQTQNKLSWALVSALIGTALSLLLWWIATGREEKFRKDSPPSSPLGGDDPNLNLQGNLDGIEA